MTRVRKAMAAECSRSARQWRDLADPAAADRAGARESRGICSPRSGARLAPVLHLRGSGARRGVARRAREQQELGEARGQPLLSVGGGQ